jgi:hypothetical protein
METPRGTRYFRLVSHDRTHIYTYMQLLYFELLLLLYYYVFFNKKALIVAFVWFHQNRRTLHGQKMMTPFPPLHSFLQSTVNAQIPKCPKWCQHIEHHRIISFNSQLSYCCVGPFIHC